MECSDGDGLVGTRSRTTAEDHDSRRSPEVQARATWTPPSGVLGRLCKEAEERAAALRPRVAELRAQAADRDAAPRLEQALSVDGCVQIIAEIKRSSPSKGTIDASI